jgi:DNA-binding LytR/AlgR family response regulator
MLGIVICDDDRFMLDMSADAVLKCIEKENLNARIVCVTQDTAEVLLFIKKNPGDYLYFLDIDFGRAALNGVDVARLIKKQEPLSKIVFVTSHADMGMDILKSGVEAFGFIEKIADRGKMLQAYKKYIRLVLENTQDNIPTNEAAVNLLIGIDEYVSLPISQILYVDTDKTVSHFVRYHTVDGSDVSVRDTIDNVLQKLGDDFMKSHRSVIVNKNYVVSVSDGVVNFAGGEQADCSFRLRSEVIKKCGVKKV